MQISKQYIGRNGRRRILIILAAKSFLYHETKREHLPDIKEGGIIPTSYGQSLVDEQGGVLSPEEYKDRIAGDFLDEEGEVSDSSVEDIFNREIPEEDRIPRTYIWEKEPAHLNYGDILLRFPRHIAGTISRDVDPYITKSISPEDINVKLKNKWYPLIA